MHLEIDVRHVLDRVQAPTLMLHCVNDTVVPVESARYLATAIQGTRYVELAGADHTYWTDDAETILDEIEAFLTGARPAPDPDRILATVLSQTSWVPPGKQRHWEIVAGGNCLSAPHQTVRRQLTRYRGRELDTAGDGFLATFDGPARAIRCAWAIRDALRALGIQIRAGLHTGEVEIHGQGVAGIAVHIGARVASVAEPDEVLMSSTVKDLVAGSGITFVAKGSKVLKGVAGNWNLFAVQAI